MHIGFKVYNKHFRLMVRRKIRFSFLLDAALKSSAIFNGNSSDFGLLFSRENGVFL